MIENSIIKLVDGKNLAVAEMRSAIEAIMQGDCTDAEIAAFLTAMRMKGETVDEIVGAATVMREHVTRIKTDRDDVLDTCGTGGDALSTFNISTATALVAASCGVPVAKHGNRGFSCTSGSAEELQELGVNIEVSVPVVEQCIGEIGVGFCYAPLLHPSMRHAVPVRKQIRFRTIFNILGPLTNPAQAQHQLLGVSRRDLVEKLGEALSRLGTRHAYVVCGHDGLDEVTLTGPTFVSEVRDGTTHAHQWHPEDFDLPACRLEDLRISSATESAERIREVLRGKPGPCRDIVVANAAAALLAAEQVGDLRSGVLRAAHAIDAGRAKRILDSLIALTQSVSKPAQRF
jgi:anthranilate phosphoribosyltransferase